MEATREELKTKREAEKEALKAKLAAVKDAKKKEAVERLDKKFDEINAKMSGQWTNTLARLEELLGKITSRADKAAVSGSDVSVTRSAVESAKSAIESARTAIAAQAAKTYPIVVTTEDALKSAVAQTRELMNKDLQAVRDAVQAAHKAVSGAASSLKSVPRVNEEPTATSTSTGTNTQ